MGEEVPVKEGCGNGSQSKSKSVFLGRCELDRE